MQLKSTLNVFFLSLCLLFLSKSELHAQTRQDSTSNPAAVYPFPSYGITILKPEGFVVADNFIGFIHPTAGVTLEIREQANTNYVFAAAAFTPERMAAQGITVDSKEEVTLDSGKKGLLYKVSFVVDDIPHQRYMLLTGTYNKMYLCSGTFSEQIAHLVSEVIKESLLTLTF